MELIKLKIILHNRCSELVEKQITRIKTILQEVQDAANNETKSSAGDKHETGRAMAQLETEKLSHQLNEALKLEQVFQQINSKQEHKLVGLGSLVITNNGKFYISVSLGKIKIDNEVYFAISAVSPIAKQLLGLKINSTFYFNQTKYIVKELI